MKQGEAVSDRPELANKPVEDVPLQLPGLQLGRIANQRGIDVGGAALPTPKPRQHPRALASALLNFMKVAEQVALELRAVFRRLTGPKSGDELCHGIGRLLLSRVHQDGARVLLAERYK
jgi:hypothetical protein